MINLVHNGHINSNVAIVDMFSTQPMHMIHNNGDNIKKLHAAMGRFHSTKHP